MFIELSRDRDKEAFRARVKLVDANNNVRGTREMAQTGALCTGIIDTLALSMSIAIDPDSLTRPKTEPEPPALSPPPKTAPEASETSPETTPRPPPESPPPPERSSQRAHSAQLELWLAPALWLASGPAVAGGGEIGARVRWERWSAGLSMRGDLPAVRTIDAVDVSFGFLGASAAACGHLSVVSACALTTLGRLTASSNAAVRRDASSPRLLLGASVGVEVPANDTSSLFARAIGNGSIGDQTVVLSGKNVYELPQLSVGFELGGVIRF
jgi:hypothetical protein